MNKVQAQDNHAPAQGDISVQKPPALSRPKPKEKKQGTSILEGSALLPGVVIATTLLVVATGFGIVKLIGGRAKKERPKASKMDG